MVKHHTYNKYSVCIRQSTVAYIYGTDPLLTSNIINVAPLPKGKEIKRDEQHINISNPITITQICWQCHSLSAVTVTEVIMFHWLANSWLTTILMTGNGNLSAEVKSLFTFHWLCNNQWGTGMIWIIAVTGSPEKQQNGSCPLHITVLVSPTLFLYIRIFW
jgi:hypothetical protein